MGPGGGISMKRRAGRVIRMPWTTTSCRRGAASALSAGRAGTRHGRAWRSAWCDAWRGSRPTAARGARRPCAARGVISLSSKTVILRRASARDARVLAIILRNAISRNATSRNAASGVTPTGNANSGDATASTSIARVPATEASRARLSRLCSLSTLWKVTYMGLAFAHALCAMRHEGHGAASRVALTSAATSGDRGVNR